MADSYLSLSEFSQIGLGANEELYPVAGSL